MYNVFEPLSINQLQHTAGPRAGSGKSSLVSAGVSKVGKSQAFNAGPSFKFITASKYNVIMAVFLY